MNRAPERYAVIYRLYTAEAHARIQRVPLSIRTNLRVQFVVQPHHLSSLHPAQLQIKLKAKT